MGVSCVCVDQDQDFLKEEENRHIKKLFFHAAVMYLRMPPFYKKHSSPFPRLCLFM